MFIRFFRKTVLKELKGCRHQTNFRPVLKLTTPHVWPTRSAKKLCHDITSSSSIYKLSQSKRTAAAAAAGGCSILISMSASNLTNNASITTGGNVVTEVERKFVLRDLEAFQEHLKEQGATLVKSISFTDAYYDTADCSLTLADFWLRQRESIWELKCPPPNHKNRVGDATSTRYAEHQSVEEILSLIAPLLDHHLPVTATATATSSSSNLEQVLLAHKCEVFTRYTTQRQTYILNDTTIDLDSTDFGYSVGEIERVADTQTDIDAAVAELDQLADKLGVQSKEAAQSKMSAYLQKFRPDIYKIHLAAGLV